MKRTTSIREITPLKETDVFYIADRQKTEFDYPMHTHSEYELNFVQNAKGVTRIVGDSSEIIDDYDLVLIANSELSHVWLQNGCHTDTIREVTIQFMLDFEHDILLRTNPFRNIRYMIERAKFGLAFPLDSIMKVYSMIDSLSQNKNSLEAVTQLLLILQTLSNCDNARTLASSNYANLEIYNDSKVITNIKNYIEENYGEEIRLADIANLANMSTSAFSRFFKLHTGITLRDYIIEVRMSHVVSMLTDTDESIVNISFFCGFNNLSNFNRLFLRKKGCTPSSFRKKYHKTSNII